MHKLRAGLAILLCVGALAGCTTNTNPGNVKTGQVAMTLAVGTLNDAAGTLTGTVGVFLNAVATFRNIFGASAFLNPGTATLTTPSAGALNVCGVFSYGQNPVTLAGNLSANGKTGAYPANLVFGLPNAFPAPSNGVGFGLGILYFFQADCAHFQAPPAAATGSYTLSTTVTANGQNQMYSATANMAALHTLGAESAPTFTPTGGGGGTFTISQPAGVVESLVVIVGSSGEAATLETFSNSATLAAGTLPSGSYTAFSIGADYQIVENGPPLNISLSPNVAGASGTVDITVSPASGFAI